MNKTPRISVATRRAIKPSRRQAETTMYFANPKHQNIEDSLFVESAPLELQDVTTEELFSLAFDLRRRIAGGKSHKDAHGDAEYENEMDRLKLRSVSKELARRKKELE